MAQTHYKHRFRPTTPKLILWGYTIVSMLTWVATALAATAQPTSSVSPNLAAKNSPLGSASNNPNNPIQDSIWMDSVQKQTIKYFWDFAHPTSGLARERSNVAYDYGSEVVTTGGSGMGFMSLIVGVERGWLKREDVVNHLLKTVKFLAKADHYHGIFPHWLNGETGKTIPFSRKDDGGDVVESAYLFQGLLCARAYFNQTSPQETELRNRITWLWSDCEWNWYTQNQNTLYWHWSPNNGWSMNHKIQGWNECLIAYVLAASHPRFAIDAKVYHKGWTAGNHFKNGKTYLDVTLPLGFDYGGPLFFSHYSFLGLNPRGLEDRYANYFDQNVAHTLINYKHCQENPLKFKGYGPGCWGLTASDNHLGYAAHSPTEDLGVISPTAALSAMPYLPEQSLAALRNFFNVGAMRNLFPANDTTRNSAVSNGSGSSNRYVNTQPQENPIWGPYGFRDAFCAKENWVANSYLAIDQGPIVVMIENYRSGLLWNLFMNIPEIQNGLKTLDFTSPHIKN